MRKRTLQTANKQNAKTGFNSLRLVVLLLFVAFSTSAHAYRLRDADVTVVNGIITQCTYDINTLGNIIEIPETLQGQTITGLGDNCFQLAGKIKEVTLPSTLKTIGTEVFRGHNLTNLELPEGLTTIGQNAFWQNNIVTLNLPNSIKNIGHGAFKENQIATIIIPEGLTVIESEVFGYNKIEELIIPKNIMTIRGSAFTSNLLKNLTIPNTLSFIGESSFAQNRLETLTFEEGCILTSISFNSFSSNNLSQIVLPNSLKVIDNYAFTNNSLISVICNKGLQKIGKRAFSGCKLSTVNLPDGLIYLGSGAFKDNLLISIQLPSQNMGEFWTVSDGTTLNNGDQIANFDPSYIVRIPYTLQDDDVEVNGGSIIRCSYTNNIENIGNAITIPQTLDGQEIVSISAYAFRFAHISEVNFPPTINAIYYSAFGSCEINNLTIPSSVKILYEYCFSENNITSLTFEAGSNLKAIENYAFAFSKLTNVTIPGSVSRIGRFSFSQNNINSIIFEQPSQLTTIESDAFNYNYSLSDFTLPEPVIAGYEYQGWIDGKGVIHKASLNNLTINDFSTYYRVLLSYTLTDDDVVVDKGVIISCSYDFTASNIIIPDILDGQQIIGLGHYVFKSKGITNITLPSQLEFIGYGAFQENNLTEITIPATTDSIADYAFYYNYINEIIFGEIPTIQYIGSNSFRNNNIDSLIIPNTVELIASQAFENSKINYLEFESGCRLSFIGESAFRHNNIGHDIYIPPLLKEVGKDAFVNNPIKHIYLNNAITDIGEGAFWNYNTTPTIDPLPTPETIPFVTWFIRWRDSDNNTLAPGYVITDFTKGYRALIDQYINVKFLVYDDNGLALQGATIQFSDSLMITNAFGRDSIAPVMRGVHNYTVSATGCLSQAASVDVQDDTSLQIILNRLYKLHVKIVDDKNNPIQNVHIEIGDSILQSNTQGEANLLLIDGNYTCMASLSGYSIDQADFIIHDADESIIIQLNPATITYHPNGGAETAFSETATGSTYQIENNSFTRLGYRFIGWNTLANGSGTSHAEGANLTLEPGNLNLYAIWQLNTYQISYDLRGGQNDVANPATYTINSATIQLKPAIATASTEAYFEGWFDADGNKVETIPQGSTGDINLWASFITEPSYLINYQNVMNGIHSNPNTYTQNDLPLTLLPANQNGYSFGGWFNDENFTQTITSIPPGSTGNKTVYAKWSLETYSIQYVLNGGTNAAQNPASFTIESNITLQAASKQGYTFEGWFNDENFTQAISSIPAGSTGNKTVYAKWNLETYSIQYVLNGGTNAAQNPASYTIESNITFHAASKQGYTFGGWFSDENFTQAIASIPSGSTGNKTVYAKWTSLYLLNFEITTDGSTPAPNVSVIVNNANPLISDNNGLVQLPCENDFQFTYRVVLDDVEITFGSGDIQSSDQLVEIEIVNAYMRWYDVIFCDNGLHLWTAFEWQKSGQTISNEQFFHNEGGIESGQYSVIVTSPSGKKYMWTKSYENKLFALSFYPNPVLKSQELTIDIKGIDDFNNCELLIYNSSGQIVHKNPQVASINRVQLSSSIKEGIYLLVLTHKGKQLSAKQFIVR